MAEFRWSKMVWIISILTTLLLIGTMVATLCIPEVSNNVGKYAVIVSIAPLPIICFMLSPRRLYLIGNALIIKRWVGKITILTQDIVSISPADKSTILSSTRIMGNGGYFGFYGYYHNRQYGKFRMFASEITDLYLIETKRQKFVVSCTNRELIDELVGKIKGE